MTHRVSAARARQLVLLLGAIMALGPLTIDMYLPALPRLGEVFSASEAQVRLTLGAYLAALAIGQLAYGPLTDRYGRRRALLIGLSIFTVASLGCALAWSIEALIAMRVLQALGGCAGMVVVRAVVRDLYDPREAARTFSLLMLVMGAAPILAPMLGGQFLHWADWPWIFVLLGVYGAACVFAVRRLLPETLDAETAQQNRALPWRAVIGDYVGLMRHRGFVAYALTGGFGFAAMFAYISGSPFVLMRLHGVSPAQFGVYFGVIAFAFIASSQVNARLLRHHSPRRLLAGGMLVYLAGTLLVMAAIALLPEYLLALMLTLAVALGALGFVAANATALALAAFSREAGAASALLGTLQLGVGAVVTVMVGVLHDGSAVPMGGLMILAAVAATLAFHAAPAARPD